MQVVSKRSFQSVWYSGKEMWLHLRLLGLEEGSEREKRVSVSMLWAASNKKANPKRLQK